ncbi:hypothetical protein [Nitrosopumilus sp.]|uniref:hypothetical protein n=1 Tax=Nitrosopumilus sp. TaxID=2024843 RepID=UPI00292D3EE8|nr:hypothetical protein [Nitrosopumilus sp.]
MRYFTVMMSAILISSLIMILVASNDSVVFASHGNPSHHEKIQQHKQQAMQFDEQCNNPGCHIENY